MPYSLTSVRQLQGRYKEAEQDYLKVSEIARQEWGPDDPTTKRYQTGLD